MFKYVKKYYAKTKPGDDLRAPPPLNPQKNVITYTPLTLEEKQTMPEEKFNQTIYSIPSKIHVNLRVLDHYGFRPINKQIQQQSVKHQLKQIKSPKGFHHFGEYKYLIQDPKHLYIITEMNRIDDFSRYHFPKMIYNQWSTLFEMNREIKVTTIFKPDKNFSSSIGQKKRIVTPILTMNQPNHFKFIKRLLKYYSLQYLSSNLSKGALDPYKMELLNIAMCERSLLKYLALDLSENKIQKQDSKKIIELISLQIKSLEFLDLNLKKSRISIDIAVWLGKMISKCPRLKELTLNLNQNSVSKEGVIGIVKGIHKCLELTKVNLDLSGNSIGQTGIIQVGQTLEALPVLNDITLVFDKNHLQPQAAEEISKRLIKVPMLQNLNLSFFTNAFGDEGIIKLGALSQCQKLNVLTLNVQMIQINTTVGVEEFLNRMNDCKTLTKLKIDITANAPYCQNLKINRDKLSINYSLEVKE